MSENTTFSPEQQTDNPKIEGIPDGMQLEALDKIVGHGKEIRRAFAEQDETDSYRDFKEARLDELLAENGFQPSEDDEVAQASYDDAKNLYMGLLPMKAEDWQDGGERERIEQRLKDYAERTKPDDSHVSDVVNDNHDSPGKGEEEPQVKVANGKEMSDAQQEVDARLEDLTSKYSSQVAERSKRMVEGAKTREDINATKEELSDVISAIATQYMVELESEGKSWDEITKTIDAFVTEQTDSILGKMEQHRLEEYNNSRPFMKKIYDTWARWGEGEGITKGKVAKTIVIAIPSAAAGAVLMPLAGAVGMGAGIGLAGFMSGKAVARRLAGAKLDNIAGIKTTASEQRIDMKDRIERANRADVTENDKPEFDNEGNVIGKGRNLELVDIISERSEIYRQTNLRRTVGGVAISAVAGLAGGAAADAATHAFDNFSFGKLGEKIEQLGGKIKDGVTNLFEANPSDSTGADTPERQHGGIGAIENAELGGGGSEMATVSAPPEVTGRGELFDGFHATRELTPDGKEAILDNLNNYKVQPGDTIWDVSEKMLEEQGVKNPSVYEIDATKDFLVRELQDQGYADSRGWLNAGDTIKLR